MSKYKLFLGVLYYTALGALTGSVIGFYGAMVNGDSTLVKVLWAAAIGWSLRTYLNAGTAIDQVREVERAIRAAVLAEAIRTKAIDPNNPNKWPTNGNTEGMV